METKAGKKPGKKLSVGNKGESLAAEYFIQRGYAVIARNMRTPHGEIDLIVQRRDLMIFVEVKTRTSLAYGYPETSLTVAKQAHFLAAIQYYLQQNPQIGGDWRADVLAVRIYGPGRCSEIVHFENVLSE